MPRHSRRRKPDSAESSFQRQQRLALRRKVHKLAGRIAQLETAIAFCVWRKGEFLGRRLQSGVALALKGVRELGLFVTELRALNPALRLFIRRDRRAYLAEVADAAAT